MMSDLYTIKDERTVYCRAAMKANGGIWNPVTREWMFQDPSDHANAAAELYRVTRPSAAMREALEAMIADGTAALGVGLRSRRTVGVGRRSRSQRSLKVARRGLRRAPRPRRPPARGYEAERRRRFS